MTRPSCIGNYLDFLDEDNASYPGDSELFSIGSAVGKKLGLVKIGIHVETILPGRRTSYPHAESLEEEFAFVLEGTPDVFINGNLYPLKPGDFVAFPSGTGIIHSFLNNSQTNVRMLVGGEANKTENKIIYPLNDERNLLMKTKERLWENAPIQVMGPHNGKPNQPSNLKWNIPELKTKRLVLRPFELSDAAAVFKYASNPKVTEFVTWHPHKSVQDSEGFIKFAHSCYLQGMIEPLAITLNGEVIGTCGAFWSSKPMKIIELGAVLSEAFWGQGIMTEALEKMIEAAWTHYDVVRIQSRCKVGNVGSRRMMEKLGMEYEGTLKKSLFVKGESWDMEMFSLTK